MTAPPPELRVDATLRVIIVGFRVVAAVWIPVLGIIFVVGNDASTAVVVGAVGLAWLLTGLTVLVARRGKLDHPVWLVAELSNLRRLISAR